MSIITYFINNLFPDALIYGLTLIIFVLGLFKCCLPILRNTTSLRHATETLRESTKAKIGRPVWTDPNFLGKRLSPVWRSYLQSAELGASSGVSSDVAEYVHDDTIINDPGKATLAEVIPGLCTSLGILGTFVGLSMGMTGLDVMEINSYVQLTTGISLAFNTSIVGLIASLVFNIIYRYSVGRARRATDTFVATFYAHAIAQPPDASTQILTYEREQADAMAQFAKDMSVRMGGEIQRAITASMTPVMKAMEDFLNAATRAQVDGLDYIVARFIDRMNTVLDGELGRLRQAIAETADNQLSAQQRLDATVSAMGDMTQTVSQMHNIAEQLVSRFSVYVGDMGTAYRKVSEAQADTGDMLETLAEASERQAKYLSALETYQQKLTASFQEYTLWTDRFVGGLEDRTAAQNAALENVSAQMQQSADVLAAVYRELVSSVLPGGAVAEAQVESVPVTKTPASDDQEVG